MTLRLRRAATPTDADRAAIVAPLRAFNVAQAGDPGIEQLALLLEDDSGNTLGGLWGRIGYDWLFVEYLSVPEEHRTGGWGRKLMAEAEAIARARGLTGIWLDTYDWQARPFYEKLGFKLFGTIEDFPPGHERYFLKKKL